MRGLLDIEQLADYLSTDPSTILRWTEEGRIPAPWTFEPSTDDSVSMHRWPTFIITEWLLDHCPSRKPMPEDQFLRIRRDIPAGILAKRLMANDKRNDSAA